MARPRKKPDYDPEQVVKEFLGAVADAFGSYDDRNPGGSAFPGLNAVAVAFGMTALKARKLLITAGVYSTEMSRRVAKLRAEGYDLNQMMEATGLGRASVHSYLPYTKIPYKMAELSGTVGQCGADTVIPGAETEMRGILLSTVCFARARAGNEAVEHAALSPRLCVLHCKRAEVHLQNQRRRDVRQPEIQADHTGSGIHGVSESGGAWGSRCRTEKIRDLWGQLPVSCFCEDRGNRNVSRRSAS